MQIFCTNEVLLAATRFAVFLRVASKFACCAIVWPRNADIQVNLTAVNRPREQAKDSEVFCTLAASGVEQAKKLAAVAKVCPAEDCDIGCALVNKAPTFALKATT